jgi:hypothetical protein
VTAYQLTPVGPEGRQEERSREIEVLAYNELLAENVRLRAERAQARADAEVWHLAWATAVNNRVQDRERVGRAMRVLASIGRASPFAAALVERARREVYGRLL